MQKKIAGLFALCLACLPCLGFDGLYLGGRLGTIGFTPGTYDSANDGLAYGADVGLRLNRIFEIQAQFQTSGHSSQQSTLNQISQFFSLEVHPFRLTELNLSVGVGAGKVWFSDATGSESLFAANFGVIADFVFNKSFVLGVTTRYYNPFNSHIGNGFWCAMLRVGWNINFNDGDRIYIH